MEDLLLGAASALLEPHGCISKYSARPSLSIDYSLSMSLLMHHEVPACKHVSPRP